MIIGLTGTMASGKTTVAKILVEKGFQHFTYSDILRVLAKERGIEPTREHLQRLGAQLKQEQGSGALSKLILARASSKHIVADGVRTVGEIEELKRHPGAYVWAIIAPEQVRFERIQRRERPGDPKTIEEFRELDQIENTGKTKGQDINACIAIADERIVNDSGLDVLKKKCISLVAGK